jgi:hypothetical protein
MTLDPLSVVALVVSVAALVRSSMKTAPSETMKTAPSETMSPTKKRDAGNRTAVFAWVYARAVTPKDRPELLEKCALQTFELIDVTVDGRRDFTRDEAREFIATNKGG